MITNADIGKLVKLPNWDSDAAERLLYISPKGFPLTAMLTWDKREKTRDRLWTGEWPHRWLVVERPKKKILLAKAWYKYGKEGEFVPTPGWYTSQEDARRKIESCYDVCWPALPNTDGFYERPE